MMRTLDRYLIRESIGPFLLALGLFTFVLAVRPVLDVAEGLLAKGVPLPTVGFLLLTLLPQALGITLPMAFLAGTLMAFGRLSGDRETVAILACGVNPLRLLRPVLITGVSAALVTLYVMVDLVPNSNQKFREVTARFTAETAESDIKPHTFYEGFPNKVLYVQAADPAGGWDGVLLADTSQPTTVSVALAERGHLVLDKTHRLVNIVLEQVVQYVPGSEPGVYNLSQAASTVFQVDPTSVLGTDGAITRGFPEMTIADLQRQRQEKVALAADIRARLARGRLTDQEAAQLREQLTHLSPHNEIMFLHQKFSFPVACLVFAVIGLALGLSVAREGKLAGFVVGVAVVFAYYIFMELSESATKGYYSDAAVIAQGRFLGAHLARWVPNIVLGVFGIAALVARARHTEGLLPFRYAVRLGNVWKRRRPAAAQELTATVSPARRHERRAVVVVRVPRLRIPTLRLIDRYISRIYLRVATLSFCALLGLFYISTFIDKSEKLLKGKATTADVFRLMVYMTPQFVYFTIPIAALLSALVTFGVLSRSSELTVLKACGVSVYRTALSVVLLSLVFSGVLFGLEQRILGRANRQAEVLDAQIRDRPPRMYDALNRRWIIGREGDIYHFAFFDPERNQIQKLYVYRPAKNSWALQSTTYAERAAYGKDGWQAADGWVQEFGTDPPRWAAYAARPLTGLESPDYFKTEQPLAEMMTVGQLKRYVQELSASGFNVIPQAVELHKKLAFPFVTFVMTLLAVPFGVATGRRGTLYGIGLGIVIALSYWILISAFVAIGKGGLLAPVLAGWAPNILVFGMASYMMLTVRT
jgi:lipopolysaccharide export system permease protein